MLDSLVRVSRRVGGAADLLATEMRAVPVRDTRYTSPLSYPPGAELGERGSGTKAPNFTRSLSRHPAVRCVKGWRNAATDATRTGEASLRIAHPGRETTLA